VPFAGSAAEPPFSAQAPAASRRPQIASCGFALRRGGRRAALPLASEGTRRLSERTLGWPGFAILQYSKMKGQRMLGEHTRGRYILNQVSPFLGVLATATLWWVALKLAPGVEPIPTWWETIIFAAVAQTPLFLFIVLSRRHIGDLAVQNDRTIHGSQPERATSSIIRLRSRARSLRRGANLTLTLMLIALSAGLSLFYVAAEISGGSSEVVAAIQRYAAGTAGAMDRLDERLKSITRYVDSSIFQSEIASTPTEKARIDRERTRAANGVTNAANEIAASAKAISQSVATVQAQVLAVSSSDRNRHLISTISTRVGAVLIIIFLVQILITLYRYSLRLAAYYDARADALELAIGVDGCIDPEMLRTLAAIISPDTIEFGRGPKSPAEAGLEFAKAVLAANTQKVSS